MDSDKIKISGVSKNTLSNLLKHNDFYNGYGEEKHSNKNHDNKHNELIIAIQNKNIEDVKTLMNNKKAHISNETINEALKNFNSDIFDLLSNNSNDFYAKEEAMEYWIDTLNEDILHWLFTNNKDYLLSKMVNNINHPNDFSKTSELGKRHYDELFKIDKNKEFNSLFNKQITPFLNKKVYENNLKMWEFEIISNLNWGVMVEHSYQYATNYHNRKVNSYKTKQNKLTSKRSPYDAGEISPYYTNIGLENYIMLHDMLDKKFIERGFDDFNEKRKDNNKLFEKYLDNVENVNNFNDIKKEYNVDSTSLLGWDAKTYFSMNGWVPYNKEKGKGKAKAKKERTLFYKDDFINQIVASGVNGLVGMLENEEDKNKLIKALENDRVFYLWAVNSDENTFESIVDKLPNILNKKDKHNNSIAHYLATEYIDNKNENKIKYLIDKAPNIFNEKNNKDKTPLEILENILEKEIKQASSTQKNEKAGNKNIDNITNMVMRIKNKPIKTNKTNKKMKP